tara:strand:- start:3768 stop:4469 length:702 start_codon:yes stop_codon:yes gene_type:complete
MNDTSLVIPVYNEEENLDRLLLNVKNSNLYDSLNNILIVDDCSTDDSLNKIKNLSKKYSKIIYERNTKNMGQSYSIHFAASILKENILITIDGDCQNDPKDAIKLLNAYKNNPNIYLVGGIRVKRQDIFVKKISSKIANWYRKKILDDNCDDTGCALKVFDRKQFLEFPFFNGMHRFLPALFKGFKKDTMFLEVNHFPRKFGNSKYGIFDRLFVGIIDTYKVKKIIKKYRENG